MILDDSTCLLTWSSFSSFFSQNVFFFLQLTQEALQHSYREVQMLQKHRDMLQKQLGDIATKINSGMIPDPEDLELPDLQSDGTFHIEDMKCHFWCTGIKMHEIWELYTIRDLLACI